MECNHLQKHAFSFKKQLQNEAQTTVMPTDCQLTEEYNVCDRASLIQ